MELTKLKEYFESVEDGKLTYDQVIGAIKDSGMKLADLSEGNYVSKQKYEDDLQKAKDEIETLTGTISTRDTDLADLQAKLEAAGTDAEKLTTLSNDFNTLKGKYTDEVKAYKEQLKKQAYEFAVKEFASGKEFTSNAAKRDFINSMIAKDLKIEDGKIIGADDFVAIYTQNNEDAFVKAAEPEVEEVPKPQFIASTQGDTEQVDATGGFMSAFHFTPIHQPPVGE